jgi:translation initiation factor IF-1
MPDQDRTIREDGPATSRIVRGRRWMAKDDLIELQGTVVEVLAGGNYKIKVSENHEVLARLNGKMRQYRIRVIQGDRVTVGVSPYDLKRGLITYRAK